VGAAVTTEHDWPRRKVIDEGPGIANRDLRRKRATDDPTETGNADDESVGHGNSGDGALGEWSPAGDAWKAGDDSAGASKSGQQYKRYST
jgi:hypothetical protein